MAFGIELRNDDDQSIVLDEGLRTLVYRETQVVNMGAQSNGWGIGDPIQGNGYTYTRAGVPVPLPDAVLRSVAFTYEPAVVVLEPGIGNACRIRYWDSKDYVGVLATVNSTLKAHSFVFANEAPDLDSSTFGAILYDALGREIFSTRKNVLLSNRVKRVTTWNYPALPTSLTPAFGFYRTGWGGGPFSYNATIARPGFIFSGFQQQIRRQSDGDSWTYEMLIKATSTTGFDVRSYRIIDANTYTGSGGSPSQQSDAATRLWSTVIVDCEGLD